MVYAGQELRTPSDAGQPSFGNRWRMPQRAELADSRDAMSCVRVDPVIRTFSPLTANGDNGVSKRAGVTSEELSILTLMAEGLTLDSVAVRVAMSARPRKAARLWRRSLQPAAKWRSPQACRSRCTITGGNSITNSAARRRTRSS